MVRGKKHRAPRLRLTEHLTEVIRLCEETREFAKGHRLKAEFRRWVYREMRDVRLAVRRLRSAVIGEL